MEEDSFLRITLYSEERWHAWNLKWFSKVGRAIQRNFPMTWSLGSRQHLQTTAPTPANYCTRQFRGRERWSCPDSTYFLSRVCWVKQYQRYSGCSTELIRMRIYFYAAAWGGGRAEPFIIRDELLQLIFHPLRAIRDILGSAGRKSWVLNFPRYCLNLALFFNHRESGYYFMNEIETCLHFSSIQIEIEKKHCC